MVAISYSRLDDTDSPVSVMDRLMSPSDGAAIASMLDGVDVLDVNDHGMDHYEDETDDDEVEDASARLRQMIGGTHAPMKQDHSKIKELEERMAKNLPRMKKRLDNKKVVARSKPQKKTPSKTTVKDDSALPKESRSRSSRVGATKAKRRSSSLDPSTKLVSGEGDKTKKGKKGSSSSKVTKENSKRNSGSSSSTENNRSSRSSRQALLRSEKVLQSDDDGPVLYSDKVYAGIVDAPDEVQRVKAAKREKRDSKNGKSKKYHRTCSAGDICQRESRSLSPRRTASDHAINTSSIAMNSSLRGESRKVSKGHRGSGNNLDSSTRSKSRRESRSISPRRDSSAKLLNSSATNLNDSSTRKSRSQRGNRSMAKAKDLDSSTKSRSQRESRSISPRRTSSAKSLNSSATNLEDSSRKSKSQRGSRTVAKEKDLNSSTRSRSRRESRSISPRRISSDKSLNSSATNLGDGSTKSKSQRGSRTVEKEKDLNSSTRSRSRRESRSISPRRISSEKSLNCSATNLDEGSTKSKSQRGSRTVAKEKDLNSSTRSRSRRESRSVSPRRVSSDKSLNCSASNLDENRSVARGLNNSCSNLDDFDANQGRRARRGVSSRLTSSANNELNGSPGTKKKLHQGKSYDTATGGRSRMRPSIVSRGHRRSDLSPLRELEEEQEIPKHRNSDPTGNRNQRKDTSPGEQLAASQKQRRRRGDDGRQNSDESLPPLEKLSSQQGQDEDDQQAMDASVQQRRAPRRSMMRNTHDRRLSVSHHSPRRSMRNGEAMRRQSVRTFLSMSRDDFGLSLDDSLRMDSDEEEEPDPVPFMNKRMSMMGRTGPRMTANSLREKLKLASQAEEAEEAEEVDSDSDEAAADDAEETEAASEMDATKSSGGAQVDTSKEGSVLTVDTSNCKGITGSSVVVSMEAEEGAGTEMNGSSDSGSTMPNMVSMGQRTETKEGNKRSGRASIVVIPCTTHKAVPKRVKKGILYDEEFSDLYDDEESLMYGL